MMNRASEYTKLREKCAVVGIVSDNAALKTAESLFALQHRGAEATGIACHLDDGSMASRRKPRLVRDAYDAKDLVNLESSLAIGHNRYSTNGSKTAHMQPVLVESLGFAFTHNGNLPVTDKLEEFLAKHKIKTGHLNDSEMMGHTIAQYIRNGCKLPEAIKQAYSTFTGAFSCVAMHDGQIAAFRDPKGIRPLAMGKLPGGYAVASETCGLDIIEAKFVREIAPGEMIVISNDGIEESVQLAASDPKLDIFEFVYFARHDSILYGEKVNEVRRRFGINLAKQHAKSVKDAEKTIVVPVPDTSMPAAEGFAETLGLKHRQAIIKNRYVGRAFMQPDQTNRHKQLRLKHTIIPEAITDKDVILIDDSIVRLNTIPRLVEQIRDAGAKSVTVLIASPPVRFPDFYGIDTPSQDELAAANMTIEQMQKLIGCSYLGYLSIEHMIEATGFPHSMFNLSCFTGEYPIDIGDRKNEIKKPVSMSFANLTDSTSSKQNKSVRIAKAFA